jgi:fructokinase
VTEIVAGVELGGTKCIAVIGSANHIIARERVSTTDAASTLAALARHIGTWSSDHAVRAIGIAAFGPIHLDRDRPNYGRIGDTPKPGWKGADVIGPFSALGLPVALDTDVAGAAIAEGRWGAAKGCDDHIYLTIGTGIGGGVIVHGRPVHGLLHPEIGHIRVRRVPGDSFAGLCPYHGDCIEGLVAGPAIAARAGARAETLRPDHPVWGMVATELAELMATLLLAVSSARIVLGGGLGVGQPQLLPLIRTATLDRLGGYLASASLGDLGEIIVPAALGDDAGPLGAIALGLSALDVPVRR